MNLATSVIVGGLAGVAVAACGAAKDAPYEGFSASKFMRSPIIGAVEAPIIASLFPHVAIPLIFLSTIATERLTVEVYKLMRAKSGEYIPGKFINGEWGIELPRIRDSSSFL